MSISTIVVGLDDGESSRDALTFALTEARRRGSCRILVVVCWAPDRRPADLKSAVALAQRSIQGSGPTRHERSMIVTETSTEPPGPTLVHASTGAELLVVGMPSSGRLTGESAVAYCVHHSGVPVVVVPPRAHPRPIDATHPGDLP